MKLQNFFFPKRALVLFLGISFGALTTYAQVSFDDVSSVVTIIESEDTVPTTFFAGPASATTSVHISTGVLSETSLLPSAGVVADVDDGASEDNGLVSESELIPSDKSVFENKNSNYTFLYPKGWNVYEATSMSYVRIENIDAQSLNSLSDAKRKNYFKIEVVALPTNNLPLETWVERQNTTSYPLPIILEQKEIRVGNQQAIYQLEQFGSLVSPAVFTMKGDNVYIIKPSSAEEEFGKIVEDLLIDFRFNE